MVVALVAVFVVILWGGTVVGGVPCAGTSEVNPAGNGYCSPDAAVCPAGDLDDITVTVVVRDCYGTPLAGQMATVYPQVLSGTVCICPGEDSKTVGPTDVTGTTYAHFNRLGGCGYIDFYAQVGTVIIGPSIIISLASPDATGDCQVDLIDFGEFALSWHTSEPCGDYNCDGIVDLVDFGTFALNWQHVCGPQ
jgi:hypothetical protein